MSGLDVRGSKSDQRLIVCKLRVWDITEVVEEVGERLREGKKVEGEKMLI